MAITIGDRVKHAIDDVNRNQFELALEHACIAIDITSKRFFSSDKSSAKNYKNLIDEYSWMLELMAMGGINVNDSVFGNYPLLKCKEPKIKDLIYHVIRCNIVHDEGLPNNFMFADGDQMVCEKGIMVLPKKLIWGLIGIVVFCNVNKTEKTEEGYWLGIFENKLVINDFWGEESIVKGIYDRRELPRVEIQWTENE